MLLITLASYILNKKSIQIAKKSIINN